MEKKFPNDFGFDSNKFQVESATSCEIKSPFSLNAEDFLEFAEKDIKGKDNKDIINALSNTKRSIENRMDLLLYAFGFDISKLNFPGKLEELNELGVVAPRILRKINKIRNLLEHQYNLPNKDDVEDAIDIAVLFIEYSNKFIYQHRDYVDGNCNGKCFRIYLKKEGINVRISGGKELSFSYTDSGFREWIRFIIEAGYF